MEDVKANVGSKTGRWRPVVLLGAILTILILARVLGAGDKLMVLRDWIEGLGPLGPVVFVFLYAAAVVAAIPGSAITIAAGALFGSLQGVAVVSIAATLGASLCFLIARYFARDATARWLSRSERFRKLDDLTERHGAIIVAITRLVPLFPFNLLNYGFGLTRVRFGTYVFWSWLCMLPGTILYVVGADVVIMAVGEGQVSASLLAAALGAAVVLFFLVRYARGKLAEREAKAGRAGVGL